MTDYRTIMENWKLPDSLLASLNELARAQAFARIVEAERRQLYDQARADLQPQLKAAAEAVQRLEAAERHDQDAVRAAIAEEVAARAIRDAIPLPHRITDDQPHADAQRRRLEAEKVLINRRDELEKARLRAHTLSAAIVKLAR